MNSFFVGPCGRCEWQAGFVGVSAELDISFLLCKKKTKNEEGLARLVPGGLHFRIDAPQAMI